METLNTSLTKLLNEAIGSHRITHIVIHEHGKVSVTIEVKIGGHYRIFHACGATENTVVRLLAEQVGRLKATIGTAKIISTVMSMF